MSTHEHGPTPDGQTFVASFSPSATFKLPTALTTDGHQVQPEQAQPGLEYYCPACHAPVRLRAGPIRHPHFAHRPDTSCPIGSGGESWEHWFAKTQLAAWLQAPDHGLSVNQRCPQCRRRWATQPFPPSGRPWRVILEYRLPSGRVVDLAGIDANGQARWAIEIFQQHAVDRAKAAAFSIPWIELTANTIPDLTTYPGPHLVVQPRQVGNAPPALCPACQAQANLAANPVLPAFPSPEIGRKIPDPALPTFPSPQIGREIPVFQFAKALGPVICPLARHRDGEATYACVTDCDHCKYLVRWSPNRSAPQAVICNALRDPARLAPADRQRYRSALLHRKTWGGPSPSE